MNTVIIIIIVHTKDSASGLQCWASLAAWTAVAPQQSLFTSLSDSEAHNGFVVMDSHPYTLVN